MFGLNCSICERLQASARVFRGDSSQRCDNAFTCVTYLTDILRRDIYIENSPLIFTIFVICLERTV